MPPSRKALLQIHFCVVLWGFTAILGRLISLPAFDLVWWRMVIVVAAGAGTGGAAALRRQAEALRADGVATYVIGLAGDDARANNEFELARLLDPKDPTAWLYSALLLEQQNRLNQAVRDLEQSKALNENRRLYRSRLLLP
jgi:tetratricopeptide (TPR) repeat protein